MNKRILIVDDEESVLNTLKRLFRKLPYEIVPALSGDAALTIMKEQTFDLIISDMRMPGMSGAEFLCSAKAKLPMTERILLTGYADMDSTVKAINDGGIFGYISKPWCAEQLLSLVESALEKTHKNKLKNKTLKHFKRQNDCLGEDVGRKEREVAQSAEFVNHAIQRLQDNVDVTEQMLLNLLDLKAKGQRKFAQTLSGIANTFADALDLSEPDRAQLLTACHLHGVGKIGISDSILVTPTELMSDDQLKEYQNYPALSACTLMAYADFQAVSQIIVQQKEYLDGSGYPFGLSGTEVLPLSCVFTLLLDYAELVEGTRTGEKLSHDQALRIIQHHKSRYDQRLFSALNAITLQVNTAGNAMDMLMPLYALRPGMILNDDVYSESDILLLPRNAILTEGLIGHLMNIERNNRHNQMLVNVRF